MKKQYISPDTMVIKIRCEHHLMAGSANFAAEDISLSSESADNGVAFSHESIFSDWDE